MHPSLEAVSVFPHTISFCCHKQMQIDAFMQMPKEKRPPKKIWDNQKKIDEWLDRVYDKDKETEFELMIEDIEG